MSLFFERKKLIAILFVNLVHGYHILKYRIVVPSYNFKISLSVGVVAIITLQIRK